MFWQRLRSAIDKYGVTGTARQVAWLMSDKMLRNSPYYSKRMKIKGAKFADNLFKTEVLYADNDDYKEYINAQIDKSYIQSAMANPLKYTYVRSVEIMALLEEYLPENSSDLETLCVGCRDTRELDEFKRVLRIQPTGLDLFSSDARIKVGDMHKMPFEDNQFDLLYSCHSLEHSYDIKVALNEFVRVLRPQSMMAIEVPYMLAEAVNIYDRWVLQSAEDVTKHIDGFIDEVVYSDVNEERIRLLIKIKKPQHS